MLTFSKCFYVFTDSIFHRNQNNLVKFPPTLPVTKKGFKPARRASFIIKMMTRKNKEIAHYQSSKVCLQKQLISREQYENRPLVTKYLLKWT